MTLGLSYLRERRELWFHRLLLHPFLAKERLFAPSVAGAAAAPDPAPRPAA